MNLPKHQHWVPQFYLRHFATPETRGNEDAQVWIFSKEEADGDETLTNVRNVCGKRYLYTPFDESGERVWNFEKKLDGLETTMGLIWPDLANGFIDIGNSTLRKGVSLFVAVMHLRNPEVRWFVEHLHHRFVEAYEEMPIRPDGIRTYAQSKSMERPTHSIQVTGMNIEHGVKTITTASLSMLSSLKQCASRKFLCESAGLSSFQKWMYSSHPIGQWCYSTNRERCLVLVHRTQ